MKFKLCRSRHPSLFSLSALCLVACGGGGGDAGTAPVGAAPTPTSGTYAWLLKAEGRTDDLKFALSLVHPQDSATEVLIEPASAAVTDAKLVASASIDTTAQQSGTLEPYALVYIVGGDVRRVPLRADGTPPLAKVLRARSTSACRFVIEAVNHVAPEQSRFIVSTAGADGRCNSADDGRAEVRLDATLGLVYTPLSAAAPLAVLRDASTLAPNGWLLPTQVQPWSASATAQSFRAAGEPLTAAIHSTPQSALVESARGLSVLNFSSSGAVTEAALASIATTGWQPVGFDALFFYVYRNSGSAASPTWTVMRVSRAAPAATQLGSGTGQVTLASMGSDVLYITTVGNTSVELRRLLKAVPGAVTVIDSGPVGNLFATVLTGAAGVHLQWRITALDTASPSYNIQMVSETGGVLYTSATGGFSLGPAEASRINFNSSESRSRFTFVEGYGARFFGDATVVSYDSVARSATRVGLLPGSADFGIDYVFANVVAGPTAPAAGFASRSINGVVQASGTRVFTFDPNSANSLRFTSRQQ